MTGRTTRRRALGLLLAVTAASTALGGPPAGATSLGNAGAIVLASDRGGHYGLYTRTAPGIEPVLYRRLVSGGTQPAYSPDGRSIAYTGGGDDPHIVVMNADGTGQRVVTPPGGGPESDPTWSPDGTRIAFTGVTGSGAKANEDVFTVSALGSEVGVATRITDHPANDHSPDWSSRGLIAFVSDRSAKNSIYTMDAEGRNVTALGLDDTRWPAWSPDGTSLAYQGKPTTIYVWSAEDGTRPVSEGSMNGLPVWSPDGTKILYRRAFMEGSTFLHRLYTVDAHDGSSPVLLSDGTSNDYMADWQPVLPSTCSVTQTCP